MDNAWISIAVPMVLVHVFPLATNPVIKEAFESLSKYPDIIRWSAIIFRFADDLGISSVCFYTFLSYKTYLYLTLELTLFE